MNEAAREFKSAIMGGFAREDVLQYISETAQKNREKQDVLEIALAEAQDEVRETKARYHEISEKNSELLERLGELTTENDALKKREAAAVARASDEAALCSTLKEKQQELVAKQDAFELEQEELLEEVEMLRARSDEYEQSKLKLAEIELCAHRHARDMGEQARHREQGMRTQTAELVAVAKREISKTSELWRTVMEQMARDMAEQQRRGTTLMKRLDEVTDMLDETVVGELQAGQEGAINRPTLADAMEKLTETETHNGAL